MKHPAAASAKDCVVPLVGAVVDQTGVGQSVCHPEKLDRAIGHASAVDLAGLIGNADLADVQVRGATFGVLREGGEDFVVIGARRYRLIDVSEQGFLRGVDVSEYRYLLDYLKKELAGMLQKSELAVRGEAA
ncbi:hypothetical protein [Variovorax sp. UMC13]|uniref:hypothetical protein n=1 Tax=Variovorax sp. UMC13 TaxID=1862326 RepID=UPI0015FFDA6C|nr:hypothetical protein [Variovorax sp. UMC13]